MSDHYDGRSEPLSRAEKESLRAERDEIERLQRELAEARELLTEAIRHVANAYDGKESLRRIESFLAEKESAR
jgi:hypothetical protein